MQRRAFIRSLGVIGLTSATWLAGCGIGGGGGGVLTSAGAVQAFLEVNFSTGVGTILPPGTELLRVQGYDAAGALVYGPVDVTPPPTNRLNLNLPTNVTVFEVFALSAQVPS